MRSARDTVWIQSCSQTRSCVSSIPSTAMLPRWLHPPSGPGSLLSRSTSTSLYPGRRRRPINVASRLPSSTLTNTFQQASSPLFTVPHLDSHFLGSTDIDSHPDAEKHLGINRNLDHDDLPQHHNHNSNLDPYDSSQSHSVSEQSHKQRLINLGPSTPPPPNDKGKKKSAEITDREWEIRTGRAIYILQQTLPDFFSLGLISSSTDNGSGKRKATPASSTSGTFQSSQEIGSEGAMADRQEPEPSPEPESIYSPKIRLVYTPPARLPSPLPATLHVEGLPLYMASSVFIRHTLKTVYSNLHVELRRVYVQTPKSGGSSGDGGDRKEEEQGGEEDKRTSSRREKSLFVGLVVRGTARVSGVVGEWEVNSTYTFSPITGLIHVHTINSIHPAPHQAAYDALRSSLERVLGLAGGGIVQPTGEVTRAEDVGVGMSTDDDRGSRGER